MKLLNKNGEPLKLTDLFVECYREKGVKIVNIPNTKIYMSITNTGGIADSDVIYMLKRTEVAALLEGRFSIDDLSNAYYEWNDLYSYVEDFPESLLAELAQKSGYYDTDK